MSEVVEFITLEDGDVNVFIDANLIACISKSACSIKWYSEEVLTEDATQVLLKANMLKDEAEAEANNVVSIAQATNQASQVTPAIALREGLASRDFREADNLLILCLNRGEDGDRYEVQHINSGMRNSECISLLHVAIQKITRDMGY